MTLLWTTNIFYDIKWTTSTSKLLYGYDAYFFHLIFLIHVRIHQCTYDTPAFAYKKRFHTHTHVYYIWWSQKTKGTNDKNSICGKLN